jgi:hypothetical protein
MSGQAWAGSGPATSAVPQRPHAGCCVPSSRLCCTPRLPPSSRNSCRSLQASARRGVWRPCLSCTHLHSTHTNTHAPAHPIRLPGLQPRLSRRVRPQARWSAIERRRTASAAVSHARLAGRSHPGGSPPASCPRAPSAPAWRRPPRWSATPTSLLATNGRRPPTTPASSAASKQCQQSAALCLGVLTAAVGGAKPAEAAAALALGEVSRRGGRTRPSAASFRVWVRSSGAVFIV